MTQLPDFVYRNIASVEAQDGDKWRLMYGYSVEYEEDDQGSRGRFLSGKFTVRCQGEVLATLTQSEAQDKAV